MLPNVTIDSCNSHKASLEGQRGAHEHVTWTRSSCDFLQARQLLPVRLMSASTAAGWQQRDDGDHCLMQPLRRFAAVRA
jgi:hypothetical protein